MLIVSEHERTVEFPAYVPVKTINLRPLTYYATVTLFATMCPYVKECADTMVYSVHDFVNLVFRRKLFMEERKVNNAMPKRAAELFKRLGAGYPKEVVRIAKTLSRGHYMDIIKKAKKYDVILKPFHTRHEIECAIIGAKLEILRARKNGLIHKAQTARDRLQELERLLESKPSLIKLRQRYDRVKAKLQEATIACEEAYYSGRRNNVLSRTKRDLSNKLKKLADQIQLEREVDNSEGVSCGADDDQSDEVPDDDEVEDIPAVGQIFVVDDSAIPSRPIPQIAVRPLLTYRIKVKHPFVLQVNQGPAQSFSYPSSDKAAIVVASNEACTGGQGILRAVTAAGGTALKQDVDELPVALHSEFGRIRCLAGDAKIVGPGSFGTLGVPYVMFAVGPWFTSENEEHKLLFLTGAYRSALKLAEEYKLEAVAFSLIGSSCRGGKSWKETVAIGLNTIIRFKGYPELKEIHLHGFTEDEATELRERSMEANATFEHMEQLE
ncbi:Macro domain [Fragilaria crotonensis]|nr:Macro domain [Fragilaria crotonensis]